MTERLFKHITTEEWLQAHPDGQERASYLPGSEQTIVIVPVAESAQADEALAQATEEQVLSD